MANPAVALFEAMSLVTSLPATFISIVECFEYVELGRRFGKDFNKCQVRLEALKLQITRWGISSGVLPDPETGKQRVVSFDAHTTETAQKLLDFILADTRELENKSRKYCDQPGVTSEIDPMQPDPIDEPTQALKSITSKIFSRRIQGVALPKKTKWALRDKKQFDRLLEDITENLNLLVLMQQVTEPQRELCRLEVEEIQGGQPPVVLELLHDASQANTDNLLEQALQKAISNMDPGHSWERTEVDDDVKLQQGDRIANGFRGQLLGNRGNHKFGVTIGKGRSDIHQGDAYGTT
ncbi:prion-inhibition and propagation domain-containing protein [Trichoderma sp. SZMC 28015]